MNLFNLNSQILQYPITEHIFILNTNWTSYLVKVSDFYYKKVDRLLNLTKKIIIVNNLDVLASVNSFGGNPLIQSGPQTKFWSKFVFNAYFRFGKYRGVQWS